jgi:hypothetical protein
MYNELYVKARRRSSAVDEKELLKLMNSVNENGIWIEKFSVHDIARTMDPNFEALKTKGDYLYAVKELEGISTRSYMANMQLFMRYLRSSKP